MGRRKKVPDKKPEEYIPTPPHGRYHCPRCRAEITETCITPFFRKNLRCTECDLVFDLVECSDIKDDVHCPFCTEKITAPRLYKARVLLMYDDVEGSGYYCRSCGRMFVLSERSFYSMRPYEPFHEFPNPYHFMEGSFRIECDGAKVVGSVAGLCSDGNYLLEVFVLKDGGIARKYVKRRMREDGSPDLPEGTVPCEHDEWREAHSAFTHLEWERERERRRKVSP